jgi:hypothetical protein
MRYLLSAAVLLGLVAATPAWAEEVVNAPDWSLGGAARSSLPGSRTVVWDGGNVVAGLARTPAWPLAATTPSGMQMGGFLAWQGEDYRLDASLTPSFNGRLAAGVGASAGAAPGELGTSYGVRFGAALAGERFTVNPASGLGLAEVEAPTHDINVTFTVNHALTPNLNVIGTAEARRSVGTPPEGGAAQNHFLFGAGLGYRF